MEHQFKKIPIEFENRYKIVPVGQFDSIDINNDNLEKGELKIRVLLAKGCPLNQGCVGLNNQNVSSFCDYLGPYPAYGNAIEDEKRGQKLPCKAEKSTSFLDVEILMVDGCPNDKANCIGCDHFIDTITWKPEADKSHCYIKCTK